MNLDRHVLRDLDDVGTLYERKLCGMGIVRLKLARASTVFLLDRPHWSETLAQLAEHAEALDDRGASWMEGMVLIDRIRAFVKHPPEERRNVLELVRKQEPEPEPEPEGETEAELAPVPDAVAEAELPEDASEPATPSLHPVRNL